MVSGRPQCFRQLGIAAEERDVGPPQTIRLVNTRPQFRKHFRRVGQETKRELIIFLLGMPSAGRGLQSRGLTLSMPFPRGAAPRCFLDDLQEFPPALAKRGRPAEGR